MPRIRKPHKTTMTTACIHPFEISNARLADSFIVPLTLQTAMKHWNSMFLKTARNASRRAQYLSLAFGPRDSHQKGAVLHGFYT